MRNKITKGLLLFLTLLVFIGIGSAAQAVVNGSFTPNSGKYAQGSTIKVDVILTPTTTHTISALNAYTYYDATAFEVQQIEDKWANGWVLAKVIDNPSLSRIEYTKLADINSTPMKNVSAPFTLYTISFKVKSSAPAKDATIVLGDVDGDFFEILEDLKILTGSRTPGVYNIYSANITPEAKDLNVETYRAKSVTIFLEATDANGDPLTYSIVSYPQHGALSSISGNTITYTPIIQYIGDDSFTYKANDGKLDSNIASVNINVKRLINRFN